MRAISSNTTRLSDIVHVIMKRAGSNVDNTGVSSALVCDRNVQKHSGSGSNPGRRSSRETPEVFLVMIWGKASQICLKCCCL